MEIYTIPPSISDLERRKLETTLDQDLGSFSLGSLISSSSTISNPYPNLRDRNRSQEAAGDQNRKKSHKDPLDQSFSDLTLEYGRAGMMSPPNMMRSFPVDGGGHHDQNTPKVSRRDVQRNREKSDGGDSAFAGASPVSTAGHHASAVTLGAGVFRRGDKGEESEFDPDRSLGRLVGELGKVVGGRVSPRPQSPFSAHLSPPRSPRSPSPLTMNEPRNLSLTYSLNQNDPLPSPPTSRSSSGSGPTGPKKAVQSSKFSSLARELRQDLDHRDQAQQRKVLGEVNDNLQTPLPPLRVRHGKPAVSNGQMRDDGLRRPNSAPIGRKDYDSVDVTGLTGLLETPAKGGKYGTINKNEGVGGDAGASIPQALSSLQARLRALETENSVSRRRIRELETEVERAKRDVESAKQGSHHRLKEAMDEKTALEDLVKSLRKNLTRLTLELEQSRNHLEQLQTSASPSRRAQIHHLPPAQDSVARELEDLRKEIERLANEVVRLGGIVELGLGARRGIDENDIESVKRDVERREREIRDRQEQRAPSKLTQGLHTSAAPNPTLAPPSAGPPTRTQPQSTEFRQPPDNHIKPRTVSQAPDNASTSSSSPRISNSSSSRRRREKATSFRGDDHLSLEDDHVVDGSEIGDDGRPTVFPSIRGEEMERAFFGHHEPESRVPTTESHNQNEARNLPQSATFNTQGRKGANSVREILDGGKDLPPQTVLIRVIRELEDDFVHYRAIYIELADQYKLLDPASHVAKRHVLADHLREVITTIERKADQIAALHDLLVFQDRPLSSSQTRAGPTAGVGYTKSVSDLLRGVKESLSEEALRKLEAEGLTFGRESGGRFEGRERHGVV